MTLVIEKLKIKFEDKEIIKLKNSSILDLTIINLFLK